MPIFDDDMTTSAIGGSGYGFSAKRIDQLGASEYTLVGLVVDRSGSVGGFQRDMEACVKDVVKACLLSPRADNLMLRLTVFDNVVEEFHGFRPLSECDEGKYTDCVVPRGATALYDATYNAVEAVVRYGKDLVANQYSANGIVIVVTDGDDNSSKMTPTAIQDAVTKACKGESLESLVTILVGVNVTDPHMSQRLRTFHQDVGFTQYIELKDASAKTLAKLAAFISKSVSAQSQSLGSGGASRPLTF